MMGFFGFLQRPDLGQGLERFAATGHAVCAEGRWHLTPKGFLVSNQIIGQVLEQLGQEKLRREQAAANRDYRVRRDSRAR